MGLGKRKAPSGKILLPAPKRQTCYRVQDLRNRLPYISHAALAEVATVAREEPLPHITKAKIEKSRAATAKQETPYGTIHQSLQIDSIKVEIQHPFAMLYHCVMVSASLSLYIAHLIDTIGCSVTKPWDMVFLQ